MAKLVYAAGLKPADCNGLVGSSPTIRTKYVFYIDTL